MLVTLVKDQAISAGASYTFSYSPKSLQKVLIRIDDEQTATEWKDAKITVQIGSKTIVNNAQAWGLVGITGMLCQGRSTTEDGFMNIDLGYWECLNNENVYVTITGGAAALTAADVSLIVDEIGSPRPLKYIEYSDTVFTAPGSVCAVGFASDISAVAEGTGSFTVTTNSYSSSFQTPSGNSYWLAESILYGNTSEYALLQKNNVPMDTSFNYTDNKVDRIIVVQEERVSRQANNQARKSNIMSVAQARSPR